MHLHTNDHFGFKQDNFIGATPQHNQWERDGFVFFEKHRLRPQFEWASQKGYFDAEDRKRFEKVILRMKEIVPVQAASLLHGDLWQGNVMADGDGQPTLIDPAVHYGWAEADLAMTVMFGGFGDEFFGAYQEVRPLETGWQARFAFYNLYHYLNHLNLFGSGYLGSVQSLLRKFG
jgi:fructosamine-3-kinase